MLGRFARGMFHRVRRERIYPFRTPDDHRSSLNGKWSVNAVGRVASNPPKCIDFGVFPLNGIRLDETVGNGLAHSVGEAALGYCFYF